LNILPALVTCIIWSLSIVLYKRFSRYISVIKINILRLLGSSIVLFIICLVLRQLSLTYGLIYAALSGILALAIGDTSYIYSSTIIGVSVAAPIAYLYVILVQFLAIIYGENLTVSKIVAALLAFISIFLIASEEKRRSTAKMRTIGIFLAFLTCVAWSFGQVVLKPATELASPIEITFIRSLSGFIVLALLSPFLRKLVRSKHDVVLPKGRVFKICLLTMLVGVLDLALGAYLFVYSIASIGVDYTVIVTGTIPVVAQLFASMIEKERLTLRYVISGILVSLSIIMVSVT